MGIIIKTDLFPETLSEELEDEDSLENTDYGSSKKYSARELLFFLLTFACGVAFGVLLMKFV